MDFRPEELLADVIARLIGDVRHVAVGNASPIPATAALLARERGKGRPYVSLLQSRKHNFWTDGARELFDCAGQGRIDVFFLSGGQIDGQGNINLVSIGDYAHPQVRFPGSFGSGYFYYVVREVNLFPSQTSTPTPVPRGRADRACHQPLPVFVRLRALHADKRASGAHGRGGDRAHWFRFRATGEGIGDSPALSRNSQVAARGRRATAR